MRQKNAMSAVLLAALVSAVHVSLANAVDACKNIPTAIGGIERSIRDSEEFSSSQSLSSTQYCEGTSNPYCLDKGGTFGCYECNTYCDCSADHFCNKNPNSDKFGKCVKMSYIGKSCNAQNTAISWAKKGDVPDDACVEYDEKADAIVSTGICVGGKCKNRNCYNSYPTFGGSVSRVLCAGASSGTADQGKEGPFYCAYGSMQSYGNTAFWNISLFRQDKSAVLLTVIMSFLIFAVIFYMLTTFVQSQFCQENLCTCLNKTSSWGQPASPSTEMSDRRASLHRSPREGETQESRSPRGYSSNGRARASGDSRGGHSRGHSRHSDHYQV